MAFMPYSSAAIAAVPLPAQGSSSRYLSPYTSHQGFILSPVDTSLTSPSRCCRRIEIADIDPQTAPLTEDPADLLKDGHECVNISLDRGLISDLSLALVIAKGAKIRWCWAKSVASSGHHQ